MNQSGLSFGKAVYFWRQAKGLTQAELAKRADLSRPNFSVIEQGGRDVTLDTVRRIAGVLEVSPGTLVDGIVPEKAGRPLSRESLDRISRFLLGEDIQLNRVEKRIARLIRSIAKRKLTVRGKFPGTLPRTAREEKRSWEDLKILLRDEEINSLIQRIDKRSVFTK